MCISVIALGVGEGGKYEKGQEKRKKITKKERGKMHKKGA